MSRIGMKLCILAFIGLVTPIAAGQDSTPAEQRREIENLRSENGQLKTERDQLAEQVTDMRNQITALKAQLELARAQIKELQSQLAAQEPDQPDPEQDKQDQAESEATQPKQAPIPADHLASPESLYRALKHEYEMRFPNPDLGTTAARKRFETRVRKWTQDVNKTMRGQTHWRVLIDHIQRRRPGRDATARMTVLDPTSGLAIGSPFVVEIPSRMVLKLGSEAEQVFDLTLMLLPMPIVNPDRLTQGVFEWPPFVGPMVDFAFDFEWIGLRRYQPGASNEKAPEPETSAPRP